MRCSAILIFLLFAGVAHRPARAQDTIPLPPSHSYFHMPANDMAPEQLTFVDTGLTVPDQYRLNPAHRNLFGCYRLTNLSQPYQKTVFYLPFEMGAYPGQPTFDTQYDRPGEVAFYNVRTPYTDLSYRSSFNVGGGTHVLHTQNLTPAWNVAAGYNRVRSLGFYANDETIWNQFRLTSHYSGLKYRLRAYSTLVRNVAQQHGGLAEDSVFTDNTERDRMVVPMALYTAEHRFRHFQIGLGQSFRIGAYQVRIPENDTLSDTVFVSRIRAFHRANWTRQIFVYADSDPNPDYYDTTYIDTARTLDSICFGRLRNSAGITWEVYSGLGLSAGLTHELFYYLGGAGEQTGGQNMRFFADLQLGLPFAVLTGKAAKGISGPDAANTFFGGTLRSVKTERSKWHWSAYGSWQVLTPGKYFLWYSGNHDRWQEELYAFNVIRLGGATGSAHARRGNELAPDRIEAHYTGIQNAPYFAQTDSIATTSGRFESVLQLKATKGFHFGSLGWDNEVMYQAIDAVSVDLPRIILRSGLYFDGRFFENEPFHVQIGAILNYTTRFNGNAYRPSAGLFLRQDDTGIGNYPYIDVFLNVRVRELSIFLTLEHVNAGWFDYRYFTAPHYPTNDLVLRFGLRWSFYN